MNGLFTILCMVCLLVLQTSCQENITDIQNPSTGLKACAAEQKIQNLIQQARNGETEAYKSLALCYRDGDGVEKSWLNMMYMYGIYCMKTGGDIGSVLKLLDKDQHFKLLTELSGTSSIKHIDESKLSQLKAIAPVDAMAVEACVLIDNGDNSTIAFNMLQTAKNEGSEIGALLLAFYYKDVMKDLANYKQALQELAVKCPFLNLFIGDLYLDEYWNKGEEDISSLKTAIDYYYKADAHGMLLPKYAICLCNLFEYHIDNTLISCGEQEIERLKRIAD